MYILVIMIMLSNMGLEAAQNWVYNSSGKQIGVGYNYRDSGYNTVIPLEDKQLSPYPLKQWVDIVWRSKSDLVTRYIMYLEETGIVVIIKDDVSQQPGFRINIISKEEFDKEYSIFYQKKKAAADIPGGPKFPEEERKLNPDELAG